jgi:AmmeMemoRadiSam system protein B
MKECVTAAIPKGRSPIVSGLFYPDDKALAEARLCSFGLLGGIGGDASAIIAPHGAWDISGAVAGAAFTAAAGRVQIRRGRKKLSRVVLLGCLHKPVEERLFLSDSDYFVTPLGDLPVDFKVSRELASCNTLFEINDIPHLREHGVEILLPFIKFCFPDVKIIPLLLGSSHPSLISSLGRALHIVLGTRLEDTLIVVSANLSKNADEARSLVQAETCIRLLREHNTEGFIRGLYDGSLSACGGAAAAALLQSGLVAGKTGKLVSGPLVKTKGEENITVYYGGFAFQ